MCKATNEYREKLANLESAAKEVEKQIFGLHCKIEGVLFECVLNETSEEEKPLRALYDFEKNLECIRWNIFEESIDIYVPSEITRITTTEIKKFDVVLVMKMTKTLKKAIVYLQEDLLPGKKVVPEEWIMTTDAIDAISEFEEAFLNYME